MTADGDTQGTGRLVGVLYDEFSLSEEIDLGASRPSSLVTTATCSCRLKNAWNRIAEHEGEIEVYLRRTPAPAAARAEKSPFELN